MTETRNSRVFPGESLPLLFAHRGCSADAPENTMAAFRLCPANGVPGVELDVHETADGHIAVIHDFTLARVAGVDMEVEASEYAALRALDVGQWFGPTFAGEPVPLLEDVYELLGRQVYYDIEIKRRTRTVGSLEAKVARFVINRNLEDRCIVSSFNPYSVRAVRRAAPRIPTALIYSRSPGVPHLLRRGAGRLIARTPVLKPSSRQVRALVGPPFGRLTRKTVITWTVDDARLATQLVRMGVDGIISNDYRVLQAVHRDAHG